MGGFKSLKPSPGGEGGPFAEWWMRCPVGRGLALDALQSKALSKSKAFSPRARRGLPPAGSL